jgi:hypothetical protein
MADIMYGIGILPDLIRKWFGPRKEWDLFAASSVMDRNRSGTDL